MKVRDMPLRVDFGEFRWATFLRNDHGDVIGMIDEHPRNDDPAVLCNGVVLFDVPEYTNRGKGPYWQVQSWEPLTLAPSIHCLVCGNHGFVREGKWVPA